MTTCVELFLDVSPLASGGGAGGQQPRAAGATAAMDQHMSIGVMMLGDLQAQVTFNAAPELRPSGAAGMVAALGLGVANFDR